MTERFLTGNLDADRLILMEVGDRELFSICIPKKDEDTYSNYAQKLCDEAFFRNRVTKYFPWTVEYKEGSLSWKKYYASLVFYISQMRDEKVMQKFGYGPFDALKYQGNPERQFNFFQKYRKRSLNNLLYDATADGELGVVKFLVERGADIHSRNDTPLRLASQEGHLEVVKYLVERGANIHASNDDSLHLASSEGHLPVVQYLVEKGADIHPISDRAIGAASTEGRLAVVQYLVQKGANIHAKNDYALKYAIRNGHTQVAEYIKSLP